MTITIELTEQQEAYITAMARQRGLAVRDIVAQMIDAHIDAGNRPMPIGAGQGNRRSAPFTTDDASQRRLHALIQDLFARSDAVERRPGEPSVGALESSVEEAIRAKYRAQGLHV